MYLAPEGQEVEIADAAAAFLADAIPMDRLLKADGADLDAATLKALAELGWFGLAVSEDNGGSGLTEVEHVLFFREVGRLCGPIDILAQCLAANAAQNTALRHSMLTGAVQCALIVNDGRGFRLLGAPGARYGLLAGPEGACIYDLSAIAADARPALDRVNTMRFCETLPHPVEENTGDRTWLLGQLATAAMLIGIAEASLDLIVEYAKVRETFGRKIGSWQAVRHPCADMAVRLEAARAQLWFAAAACKEGRGDARTHLTSAKLLANNAAYLNADSTIQLHGGIGVTEEHHAHFLLKHAMVLSRLFGGKRELLGQILHAEVDA